MSALVVEACLIETAYAVGAARCVAIICHPERGDRWKYVAIIALSNAPIWWGRWMKGFEAWALIAAAIALSLIVAGTVRMDRFKSRQQADKSLPTPG